MQIEGGRYWASETEELKESKSYTSLRAIPRMRTYILIRMEMFRLFKTGL
jgi:hypothetical protein